MKKIKPFPSISPKLYPAMLFNVTPICHANLATTITTTTPSTFLSSIVASLDLVYHILPPLVDHVSTTHWCHFPFTKGLGCLQCLQQKMHCFRVTQMHSPEPASCLLQPKSQAPGWRPYINIPNLPWPKNGQPHSQSSCGPLPMHHLLSSSCMPATNVELNWLTFRAIAKASAVLRAKVITILHLCHSCNCSISVSCAKYQLVTDNYTIDNLMIYDNHRHLILPNIKIQ